MVGLIQKKGDCHLYDIYNNIVHNRIEYQHRCETVYKKRKGRLASLKIKYIKPPRVWRVVNRLVLLDDEKDCRAIP